MLFGGGDSQPSRSPLWKEQFLWGHVKLSVAAIWCRCSLPADDCLHWCAAGTEYCHPQLIHTVSKSVCHCKGWWCDLFLNYFWQSCYGTTYYMNSWSQLYGYNNSTAKWINGVWAKWQLLAAPVYILFWFAVVFTVMWPWSAVPVSVMCGTLIQSVSCGSEMHQQQSASSSAQLQPRNLSDNVDHQRLDTRSFQCYLSFLI